MNRLFVVKNSKGFVRRVLINMCALWLCLSISALAESTVTPPNANAQSGIRATHLLGLPNTKNNCKGILSIQNSVLQFQPSGKPVAQVDIASVRHVFLGEESMQIGGTPMKIGKAAAPFGGGRVVSLFAHKKYDTLTLEYVDANGGVHGAIFQVAKGQAELVRNELIARGVSSSSGGDSSGKDQPTKQSTSEVTHETK